MTRQPQAAQTQAEFYLSPVGRDSWSGRLPEPNEAATDGPFATLGRARDAVRTLKESGGLDRPLTVMLRGGTYRHELSVVFSGSDSGTDRAPITYTAYPGERPILTGSRLVTGWKPYRGHIVAAELPTEENFYYRFRQLFCNGRRQIRARYPDYDPRDPYYGGWAFIDETEPAESETPVTLRWERGVFTRRWAHPEQGEIFVIPGLAWNSHYIPIRGVDHDRRLITVTRRLATRWDRLTKGNRFYVENLLEELDQPGEWCFDSATSTLFFWPPAGSVADGEVTVPVNDRLIELRATTGEPVRYLRFSGLTFTQTLSVFPNPIAQHPDYVDCNRPTSGGYAFYMENTEHCAVEGCRFDQVGGDAIRMHGYHAYDRLVDNEMVGVGAQGICLTYLDFWPYDFPPIGRGSAAKLRSMSSRLTWAIGNEIRGNHIHHCGVLDNFGAGIHLHGLNCKDNVIANNLIHDMPHHAIYLSMGFGCNTIELNDLHTLCLVMADAGGVYCNRWCILEDDELLGTNNIIRYNLIRDVRGAHPTAAKAADPRATPSEQRIQRPHFTWGIYFDNSPRRVHVYGNIMIGNVWGGVFLGGGYGEPSDCLVENNILVDSNVYQFDLGMKEHAAGNRFVRNIVCYGDPEAALLRATDTSGVAECDYNLYYVAGGAAMKLAGVPGETLESWRKLGFDAHSVVADPLFVSPESGDYRLAPGSPAYRLGFEPIPMERIGTVTRTRESPVADRCPGAAV